MHTILADLEELAALPPISKVGILALLILLFTLGILIGKNVL